MLIQNRFSMKLEKGDYNSSPLKIDILIKYQVNTQEITKNDRFLLNFSKKWEIFTGNGQNQLIEMNFGTFFSLNVSVKHFATTNHIVIGFFWFIC